jgi:hypothetical protein
MYSRSPSNEVPRTVLYVLQIRTVGRNSGEEEYGGTNGESGVVSEETVVAYFKVIPATCV